MKTEILYFYSAKGYGGLVRNLSLILENLDRTKFEVSIVGLLEQGEQGAVIPEEIRNRCRYVQLDDVGPFSLNTLRQLSKIVKESRAQILSCHGYKADCYAGIGIALGYIRCPTISTAHGWGVKDFKLRIYYLLQKFFLRCFFDHVILVSDSQRRELAGWGFPENMVSVVPNGAKIPDSQMDQNTLGEEFSANLPLIGFIGRLSEEKDLPTLLAAFKFIVQEVPSELLIVGDGPCREPLAASAEKLPVKFLSFRRDVEQIYPALDLFVSVSKAEGLPNSVLEAQSYGVPCILSDIAPHRELVQHGISGYLVPVGDSKQLASRIVEIIKEPLLAKKFAEAAKAKLFTIENRMRMLEELYRSCLALGEKGVTGS